MNLEAYIKFSLKEFVQYFEGERLWCQNTIERALEMFQTMIDLGMEDSFHEDQADFSGINGHRGLSISSFLQLNNYKLVERNEVDQSSVDENLDDETTLTSDTDADADATARFSMSFERQFLFVVRHNPTGLLTTIGRFFKPPEPDSDHHHEHEHHEHQHEHHDHEKWTFEINLN